MITGTNAVDDALEAVRGWLRGGVSLVNRQDVAVVLAEEVRRLRGLVERRREQDGDA